MFGLYDNLLEAKPIKYYKLNWIMELVPIINLIFDLASTKKSKILLEL